MLKKILSAILCFSLLYCPFSNASVYEANRLFQKWSEWEKNYDIGSFDVEKGNGRNFAWTHVPRIRSYIDIYAVTGDVQLIEKMKDHLEVVYSFKQDAVTNEENEQCYNFSVAGWRDTADVEDPNTGVSERKYRYFPVHQGRVLTAFLEFAELVKSDPALSSHIAKADEYITFAETVMESLNEHLYETTAVGSETVGYYLYPKQDKVDCDEVTDQKMGPYNQSLVVGTALNLLYNLTDNNDLKAEYETIITQLAAGLKLDLSIPTGQNHYEWPYWPSYSSQDDTKAEDFSHGRLDVEFMQATYKNRLADLKSNDMARFAATMVNVMDQGNDFFTYRVDGSQNDFDVAKRVKVLGKLNEMKHGWLLMAEYNREILGIAERWCISNTPHTNATLLRMGGHSMMCEGWCPIGESSMSSTNTNFDNGSADDWLASEPTCSAYHELVNFDDDSNNPEAKLNARKGDGYMRVLEVDDPTPIGGNPNNDDYGKNSYQCNPGQLNNKELSIYKDISLDSSTEHVEIAGFVRALSDSSSLSVVQPVVTMLDSSNDLIDVFPVIESENVVNQNAKDSGWQPFNLAVNNSLNPSGSIRALIGMRDGWKANHHQELRVDELRICTEGYCGNGVCSAAEDSSSCPLDCATLTTDESSFDSDSNGWMEANVLGEGYKYNSGTGMLVAEEFKEGNHSEKNPDTKDFELAWYKNFQANEAVFIVDGIAQVKSRYKDGSAVNHFCVILVDIAADDEIVRECSQWRYSDDSGVFSFGHDFTKQVGGFSNRNLRVIVGAEDRWRADHGQRVEIHQLKVTGATNLP